MLLPALLSRSGYAKGQRAWGALLYSAPMGLDAAGNQTQVQFFAVVE